jgi:hypothetical protein
MEASTKLDGPGATGVHSCATPAARLEECAVSGEGEPMKTGIHVPVFAYALIAFAALLLGAGSARAQVSPGEIANPKLKATEQAYLAQLQSLHHAIGETKFPFPFILTRYVGRDPDRQASLDTRGLEFVYFQNRMLLKTSGFYTAAFNSDELTSNERGGRTLQEVVVPILRLIVQQIPAEVECDGIGFEIAYHVRAARGNSDFEGREILAVVLDRAEAFALAGEPGNEERQAILNHSRIFLDGKPFGLALGRKDALDLEAMGRSGSGDSGVVTASPASVATARPAEANPYLVPAVSPGLSHAAPAKRNAAGLASPAAPATEPKASPTAADVEKLQAQFQPLLDTLLKEDGAKFSLVDYAPPSFAVYHRQMVLQFTLRNRLAFDKNSSSIYKRAAQSFDLFLAPQLKALLQKLPPDVPVDALDFSVLNRIGNEKDSSEAVEFICPLRSIRSFAEDEIASQDLIDQSIVLVDSVRITLDLARVE